MKCMKNLKKSTFSIFLSLFLLCCCVFGRWFTLESYAASTLLKGFLNLIGISSEVAPTSSKFNGVDWQRIATKFMRGDSLGADGGHSRENPYIVNTNPIEEPRSIVETRSSSGRNYIDCYNPVTNNYETVNNTYFNDYSDTYIFETTNNFVSYEFNETYYTICVAPVQSPTEGKFFNVYYQLPDGRNSFNLTPDDVRGIVFNYDIVDYNRTVLDESVLGLWHLDGNFLNSAVPSSRLYYGNEKCLNFIDGRFSGALQPITPNQTFYLEYSDSVPSEWTISFWMYVPYLNTILQSGVIGSDYNCIGWVPELDFIQGAWNYIVLTSDFRCFVNNNQLLEFPFWLYSPNSVNPQRGIVSVSSTEVKFTPVIYGDGSFTNIGGTNYYTYAGVMFAYDEVLFQSGFHVPSSSSVMRMEPFDLPYAYTIPNVPQSKIYTDYVDNVLSLDYVKRDSFTSDAANALFEDAPSYFVHFPDEFVFDSNNYCGLILISGSAETWQGYGIFKDSWVYDALVPYLGHDVYIKLIYYGVCDVTERGQFKRIGIRFLDSAGNTITSVFYNVDNVYGLSFPPHTWQIRTVNNFSYVSFVDSPCIGVQSPFDVNNFQVGGVRPLYPQDGDLYIGFFRGVVSSVIQYYSGVWHDVNASVFYRGQWIDVKEFDFTNLMLISDSKELSSSIGGTYIINEGSSYTYITSVSGNDLITVSGNDLNITIDSGDVDSSKLSDFINSIPLIFAFVGSVLGSMFPFLPVWLSSLIVGCLGLLFGFIVVKFIRR